MNLIANKLLKEGVDLKHNNQLKDAIKTLKSVLNIDPESKLAYQELASIYWQQGKLEEAVSLYKKLIEIDSNQSEVLYKIAEISKIQKSFDEAAKYYIEALIIEPFNNSPFIQLMNLKLHPSKLNRLVDFYQQLSRDKPNNPWVNVKLGNVLTKQGNVAAAISSYQIATYKMTLKFKPNYVNQYWKKATPAEPEFIIIGPMKTATSALYEYINKHPLVLPCIEKEIHFFNDNYKFFQGKEWYMAHFPLIPPSSSFISGEASPGYIVNNVEQRVFNLFPKIKLIALIRNPVDRAWSHYQHNVKHGFERRTFGEAIAAELAVIDSWEDFSAISQISNWQGKPGYVLIGFYYYFLQKWLKIFPQEQFLIVNNQDLLLNPQVAMKQVYQFLNLANFDLEEYPKHNSNSYNPIDPELRKKLATVYYTHNQKLEQFLNRKLNWE